MTILPHLWFDTQAKEATAFYVSLFPNSSVTNVTTISGTPSGDCDIVSFSLAGRPFMAISAGPYFTLNPSISMFVTFDSDLSSEAVAKGEAEIVAAWDKLSDGGKVMMPFQAYPWAKKYGWVQDKYGLSWQLSMSERHVTSQMITPLLMFTKGVAGKARAAMDKYVALFPNSSVDMAVPYAEGEGDTVGFLKHARFTLGGQTFMAMDRSGPHAFGFNEAVSLVVKCDTQEEIDRYWEALSAVPESEQCGWLKDKFGVSWQIVPTAMDEMMASGDAEAIDRVTKAFMGMKKFDLAALRKAYEA
jgi:predicted 3-demethylubiquinone-9 3-methyltransferase (glyoxalase superfamily)